MEDQQERTNSRMAHDLTQAMLRLILALGVLWICAKIFSPFATIMLWALILAVTLYPLHLRMRDSLGWREGFIATLIVCVGLLLLGVPLVLLGISFVEQASSLISQWQDGKAFISPPAESVKTWPIIGERLHSFWLTASNNLEALVVRHSDQVVAVAKGALGGTASLLSTTGVFLGALVIAGFMMAYGESGQEALRRIAITLAGGNRGAQLQALSVATMRSVATGVIGVAAIQALLLGLGFLWADVPGAALLAVLALLLGIMQLPALLVILPVLAWLWLSGDGSTVMNGVITAYLILAGLTDNILKPVLLGRGVDVPMPIILVGALGGMIGMGLIGLFLGSVILGVGYRLLWAWVDQENT